jgi:hypothetical protein
MKSLFMSRKGRQIGKEKEWGLMEELNFLEGMQQRERNASQLYDLVRPSAGAESLCTR